jgi:hypothetical protein
MRDQLGIAPGDEVDFSLEEGCVRLAPRRAQLSLRGSLAGLELIATLEADHRRELDR